MPLLFDDDRLRAANKTVVVVRRNSADSRHVFPWIKRAGFTCIDVCDWETIRIEELNYSGTCRLFFNSIALEEVDLVFYIGTPGSYAMPPESRREAWYRNSERTAALVSALAGAKRPQIINRGDVLHFGRQLNDPLVMLRRLAKVGWNVPVIHTEFDFQDGEKDNGTPPAYAKKGCFHPAPDTGRSMIVFTRMHPPIMVNDSADSIPDDILVKTNPTQDLLQRHELDWVTVAVARHENQTVAYGIRSQLPKSLSDVAAARILRSIIELE